MILEPLCFQILIEFRLCKGGIGPKITRNVSTLMTCHHWFQHRPPILGAMHVAVRSRDCSTKCLVIQIIMYLPPAKDGGNARRTGPFRASLQDA